jgi:hypothetical protein
MCKQTNALIAGFEVLTLVAIKSYIIWDMMPCSLVNVNQLLEKHAAISILRVEE